MEEVSFQGVLKARPIVYRYLSRTPLLEYPLLSKELGFPTLLKHEHHHPTGAFKVRGGLNLVAHLDPTEKSRGLITATRGNHGQSIAYACREFGVECLIGVPEGNNPEKNAAMEAFGARLIIHGRDFDEARVHVEEIREERRMRYVHSGNEPMLIHGVGTYALEIIEDSPGVDVILVPVGGGSGISGILTVIRQISPRVQVIGVQAERAAAVYHSWKEGRAVSTESADTIADGLATRIPFELPLRIIQEHADELVTVSEEELRGAVRRIFRTTHQVAEPASASVIAAAYQLRSRLRGRRVACVLTGANISSALFGEILSEDS